jgi:hypothetical protein
MKSQCPWHTYTLRHRVLLDGSTRCTDSLCFLSCLVSLLNITQLLDYDSNQTKGSFHTNSMRVGERFIAAPIPSLGHDYLEFDTHPLASTEELLGTSFLLFSAMVVI